MAGFIQDEHLDDAELEFPGIKAFHVLLCETGNAPRTFLDLVRIYLDEIGKIEGGND